MHFFFELCYLFQSMDCINIKKFNKNLFVFYISKRKPCLPCWRISRPIEEMQKLLHMGCTGGELPKISPLVKTTSDLKLHTEFHVCRSLTPNDNSTWEEIIGNHCFLCEWLWRWCIFFCSALSEQRNGSIKYWKELYDLSYQQQQQ